jgi:hypothetical protein
LGSREAVTQGERCLPAPWDPIEKGLYVDYPQAAGSAAEVRRLKTDIGWGHHIRPYVLDQSRIKDLRTNYEVSNTQACSTATSTISSWRA